MEKVIIFSAPSGSGKTTLVKYCLESFPLLRFSISATTRAPRGAEVHGTDYYFHTAEEFQQKILEKAFVEYEEVYQGSFYGTLQSEINRIWADGNIVIFDVDVKGGIALKKIFGKKALSIFIAPPSVEELEKRLIGRNTDDAETIKTRVAKAEQEMSFSNQFDTVVVNDDLSAAKTEIQGIISRFLTEKSV